MGKARAEMGLVAVLVTLFACGLAADPLTISSNVTLKSTATGPNELTIGWRLIPTPGRAGEVYVLEVLLHSIHTSNVSVTELYYARLHEFGNGGTSLAHVIDLPT